MRKESRFDIRKIINPYDFANPVTDERLFLGRDDEVVEVVYYLRQAESAPKPIHVAFVGERAAGKTSFLNITATEAARRNLCVVRIDLDEGDASTQLAFFRKFYHQIVMQAFAFGAFGGRSGKTFDCYLDLISTFKTDKSPEYQPLTFANIVARALDAGRQDITVPDDILKEDMILISKELKRPIIILMDECNVLKNNRVILEKLRNLMMSIAGYMLVISGTKDLFPVIDDVFSPIMRQFKQIEIGPYKNVNNARSCVDRPLSLAGLSSADIKLLIPRSLYTDIFVLSGGRPYEIQLICHFLFRQCQLGLAKRFILNVASIDQIQKGISGGRDLVGRPLIQSAKNLRKQTLEALSALALADEKLDFETYWKIEYITHGINRFTRERLREECAILIHEKILTEDAVGLRFSGDSFDRLYIKYLSRQRGVSGRVGSAPLDIVVSTMMSDILHQFREFILPDLIDLEGFKIDSSEVASTLATVTDSGTFDILPPPAEILLLRCLLRDKITNGVLFDFCFESPICRMQKFFYWEDSEKSSNMHKLISRSAEISRRAEEVGWSFTVNKEPVQLPSRTSALNALTLHGDERLRDRISSILLQQLPEAYVEKNDFDHARLLADTAFEVSGSRQTEDANNVGYLHMARGNLEEAKAWFDAAEQYASDPSGEALLQYNIGIYWALAGSFENARIRLMRSKEILDGNRERVGALIILDRIENNVKPREVFGSPMLFEAIDTSLNAIGDGELGSDGVMEG